jgi:integrase
VEKSVEGPVSEVAGTFPRGAPKAEPARRRRRGNGEGSVRRRSKSSWEARLAVVDAAGQLHRPSFLAPTRHEAVQWLRDAQTKRDGGVIAPGARETVGRFLVSWLAGVKSRLRPRTWDRYEEHVRLHLEPTVGRIPLSRLSPNDVQRAHAALLNKGLAPGTVRRAHAVLRAALQDALRWRQIASNPASLVRPPRGSPREMTALSQVEARALLQVARHKPLEALWVLAVTTGLRQGELLALRWEDVDLEGGSIRVTGTLTRIRRDPPADGEPKTHRVISQPKTAHSRRRVDIGTLAVEALRTHRGRQVEERHRAANLWVDKSLVFCGPMGGYLHPVQVNAELRRLLGEAYLPTIRFHDLRHTAATLLLGRDVNPKKVSEMLGHSTVAITLDTYSHVLPGMHRQAAEIMDELLSDNP